MKMKKIKLLKNMADENGSFSAGKVLTLPEKEAKELIDAEAAVDLGDSDLFGQRETAMAAPGTTATMPKPARTTGKKGK